MAAAKDMEKEPSESKSYKSAIAKQLEFPGIPHSMDLWIVPCHFRCQSPVHFLVLLHH